MESPKQSNQYNDKENQGMDVQNGKNVPKEEIEREREKKEEKKLQDEKISEYGPVVLEKENTGERIHLLSVIGEIEGHEVLPDKNKTTKYEHVLPQLAAIENDKNIDGLLVILNTVGGDVEAGLAIAEMIASLSKPTVSLVLGGSHSIGVPLAVSTQYSFIVPTGTMLIHPVRMGGMVIGAPQTYEYFKKIQDRITGFISSHSKVSQERLEDMMMENGELTKDLGTILIGEMAVKEGIIDEVGGMKEALAKLYKMIEEKNC